MTSSGACGKDINRISVNTRLQYSCFTPFSQPLCSLLKRTGNHSYSVVDTLRASTTDKSLIVDHGPNCGDPPSLGDHSNPWPVLLRQRVARRRMRNHCYGALLDLGRTRRGPGCRHPIRSSPGEGNEPVSCDSTEGTGESGQPRTLWLVSSTDSEQTD